MVLVLSATVCFASLARILFLTFLNEATAAAFFTNCLTGAFFATVGPAVFVRTAFATGVGDFFPAFLAALFFVWTGLRLLAASEALFLASAVACRRLDFPALTEALVAVLGEACRLTAFFARRTEAFASWSNSWTPD